MNAVSVPVMSATIFSRSPSLLWCNSWYPPCPGAGAADKNSAAMVFPSASHLRATSNAIENPVPDEVKQERYNALMARQQKISARRLKRKVGTRQHVIIDEVGPTVARGRSKADAPEIDGAVYLSSRRPLKVGEIVTAKIERSDEYDLHGSVVGF